MRPVLTYAGIAILLMFIGAMAARIQPPPRVILVFEPVQPTRVPTPSVPLPMLAMNNEEPDR